MCPAGASLLLNWWDWLMGGSLIVYIKALGERKPSLELTTLVLAIGVTIGRNLDVALHWVTLGIFLGGSPTSRRPATFKSIMDGWRRDGQSTHGFVGLDRPYAKYDQKNDRTLKHLHWCVDLRTPGGHCNAGQKHDGTTKYRLYLRINNGFSRISEGGQPSTRLMANVMENGKKSAQFGINGHGKGGKLINNAEGLFLGYRPSCPVPRCSGRSGRSQERFVRGTRLPFKENYALWEAPLQN